jgi:hypothetical protein
MTTAIAVSGIIETGKEPDLARNRKAPDFEVWGFLYLSNVYQYSIGE